MSGFIRQRKRRCQRDVVCKKPGTPPQKPQEIEKSVLAAPPSCCLQDSPAAALGLASAVGGDFVPPAQGAPGDIFSNSPGSTCATSAGSPGRPADIPDRRRSSADDNRCGVSAGMQACCKPAVEDDKGQAERFADSNGNDGRPSHGSGREWKGFILSGGAIKRDRARARNFHRIQKPQIFGPPPPIKDYPFIERQYDVRVRSVKSPKIRLRLCRVVSSTNQQIFKQGIEISRCWAERSA
jgi:hypothetical protein